MQDHSHTNSSSASFSATFLEEVAEIAKLLDRDAIEKMAALLAQVRDRDGRLFILGVGGSAGNASHAVNDFRKLAGLETYAPTDNVSELSARVNDEGWSTVFEAWLRVSRLKPQDALLVLSVGGGSIEPSVSPNLVMALDFATSIGATILGIVGRDGGYTGRRADACVIVPTVSKDRITPHSEAFQAVVWHLLISHPLLQNNATKWESVASSLPTQTKRAVFFDRDGVLNESLIRDGKPYPPATLNEVRIPAGAAEAIGRLKQRDCLLLMVTNQPDVARGTQSRQTAEGISTYVQGELGIHDVLTCYHDDKDDCDCRKPLPGLLTQAAERFGIDLTQSFLIGDRWRDIDAGNSAGCQTVWIDHGYRERLPASVPKARVKSLVEAVDWVIQGLETRA